MAEQFSLENFHVDDLLSTLGATPGGELRIAAGLPLLVIAEGRGVPSLWRR